MEFRDRKEVTATGIENRKMEGMKHREQGLGQRRSQTGRYSQVHLLQYQREAPAER